MMSADSVVCSIASVCEEKNITRAFKRVMRNGGAPGTDGITTEKFAEKFSEKRRQKLLNALLNGSYQPAPLRAIAVPKPYKKQEKRWLSIPTVADRLIQQAISQQMEPLFEPEFCDYSYGFRPQRNTYQAVLQARQYVLSGHHYVVELDLENFFDTVNHDILMSLLAKKIRDKTLLRLIRRFLMAKKKFQDGTLKGGGQGIPQGSPLSPLLSNVLLHQLDQELLQKNHSFCRYADDCNVYVKNYEEGVEVLHSVKNFLLRKLRLHLHPVKSQVVTVETQNFLGFRIERDGTIDLSPQNKNRLQEMRAFQQSLLQRRKKKSAKRFEEKINHFLQYFQPIIESVIV